MKRIKDYEPSFRLFQSEVEKIMYQMNDVINGKIDKEQWVKIKQDWEHKISILKRYGEWTEE